MALQIAGISPWTMGMGGRWGDIEGNAPLAVEAAMAARGAFGSVTGAATGLGRPQSRWAQLRHAFGPEATAGVLAAGASGGIGGLLGAAGSVAGGVFGPVGSLLGGLIGGGIGKLFGGGKKKDVGLTPANPVYTRDVAVFDKLTELLNITKGQLIAGTGAGIDRQTSQLRLQGAIGG